MLNAFILHPDGSTDFTTDPAALPALVRDPKTVFWVDLFDPSDAEVALLDDLFGFHPLAIEDAISTTERPKIDHYTHGGAEGGEYVLIVIHAAKLKPTDEYEGKEPSPSPLAHQSRTQADDEDDPDLKTAELDLFVSARYMVTVHFDTLRSVEAMFKRTKPDPARILSQGTDSLLYQLLDLLVDNYNPILDRLQDVLDDLEDEALSDPTPAVLPKIAARKRELLNLRRLIGPQRDVLAQLTRGEVPFVREQTRVYLRDVQDHLLRAVELIELYRDLVMGTRDLYLSSVSNNLNEVMKALTLITVMALPLTVVTGFFGMNFETLPGIHTATGMWIAMGCTMAIQASLIVWFKMRKWL